MPAGRARVDPESGHEQLRFGAQVGGREAERAATLVARDHDPLDLDGPPEEWRGGADLAGSHEPADLGRRHPLDVLGDARREAQPLEQGEVAAPAAPEAERLAGRHELGADRLEVGARELRRLERRHLGRERDDEHLLHAEGGQQLEPPLERREQRDLVPEHVARVRMEGDDGRPRPRLDGYAHDGLMADMDTVERPDRDRTPLPPELLGAACDPHRPPGTTSSSAASTRSRTAGATRATASAGSRASASATESHPSGAASSTVNGPTAVRRSVRQWPPSASAIART